MAYILCLETTTTNCSVALFKNGLLQTLKEDMGARYSHAERLHVYIADVCKSAGVTFKDLDAVAVSKGPGSYTGLRIGVSSAKGLCFARDLPLIATPTLQSLAMQVVPSVGPAYVIPLLDARRMEVYSAVYNEVFEELRTTEAQVLDSQSFVAYLQQRECVFIGNGAAKFQEVCTHPKAQFIPGALPSAREMGKLAQQRYDQKQFEDLAYFEPYYLKDFQTTGPGKKI